MTVASALAFIRVVRADDVLRARLAAMTDPTAEDYCASEPGFAFSQAELSEAFRIDWTARWMHFQAKPLG